MIASLQLKTEAVPAERTEEEPEERKGGQESRLGGTDRNIMSRKIGTALLSRAPAGHTVIVEACL